jgi:ornithine carbamoyltransferase
MQFGNPEEYAVATSVAACHKMNISSENLRSDHDLTLEELRSLLDLTAEMKLSPADWRDSLRNRYLCILFEKPSLRTRMTFELACKQLGADSVLSMEPIGYREPLKDMARNLERWTNAIVARVYSQNTIDELARWARIPVVNALSDLWHPCQALADVFTMRERFGDLKGLNLAYAGDGNNVAHSLMITAGRLGVNVTIACAPGYEPKPEIVAAAQAMGATIKVTNDAAAAVRDAHVVYTDVWASMGQEHEAEVRREIFRPYQVNESLMAKARPDAIFLHCLPAKRDEEVTDAVMESAQSFIFDQAENRLHTQKALLYMLLG